MKSTMKAVVMNDYGSINHLELKEVDVPEVKENQVLIKIHSSSFNPADYSLLTGEFGRIIKNNPEDHILGVDVAGTVEKVHEDVKEFSVGDRVYAYLSIVKNGSYAEYLAVNMNLPY